VFEFVWLKVSVDLYVSDSNIFCGLSDTLLARRCCIEFSSVIWCEGVASVNKRIFQKSSF